MPDFRSLGHLDPIASSILMDGLATLGLGACLVLALVYRFRFSFAATRVENAGKPKTELAPGETALLGTVELAQGETMAARVEITQEAQEMQNGLDWSHQWSEKERRVTAKPFYLKLASGERVRVEPPSNVEIVDQLGGVSMIDRTHRVRSSELSPGEFVHVIGALQKGPDPEAALEGGYRSGQEKLVLRAGSNGRMLLSTEPVGKRFQDLATFYEGCFAAFFVLTFMIHFYFMEWHIRRYWGNSVDALVVRSEQVVRDDPERGERVGHYRLVFQDADVHVVTQEVSAETASTLKEGDHVPAIIVDGTFFRSRSTLGKHNTIDTSALAIAPILVLTLGLMWRRKRENRPWYEKKVVEKGEGKLPPGDGLFLA